MERLRGSWSWRCVCDPQKQTFDCRMKWTIAESARQTDVQRQTEGGNRRRPWPCCLPQTHPNFSHGPAESRWHTFRCLTGKTSRDKDPLKEDKTSGSTGTYHFQLFTFISSCSNDDAVKILRCKAMALKARLRNEVSFIYFFLNYSEVCTYIYLHTHKHIYTVYMYIYIINYPGK